VLTPLHREPTYNNELRTEMTPDIEKRSVRLYEKEKQFRLTDELRSIRLTMLTLTVLSSVFLVSTPTGPLQLNSLGLEGISIDQARLAAGLHFMLSYSIIHFLVVYRREKRKRMLELELPASVNLIIDRIDNFDKIKNSIGEQLIGVLTTMNHIKPSMQSLFPDLLLLRNTRGMMVLPADAEVKTDEYQFRKWSALVDERLDGALDDCVKNIKYVSEQANKLEKQIKAFHKGVSHLVYWWPQWDFIRAEVNAVGAYLLDVIAPATIAILLAAAMFGHYDFTSTWANLVKTIFGPILVKLAA
jgi:hypothetical protein